MNNIVPLSDGNHAELRDLKEISERLRRPVARALARVSPAGWAAMRVADKAKELKEGEELTDAEVAQLQLSPADIEAFGEANDHGVVALVKRWTFDREITVDNVLDLAAEDYDKLREAVAPIVAALFVDFRASTDPASPTEPSSDSATRFEGAAGTDSPTSGVLTASSS